MKAVICTKYGSSEVLQIIELPIPIPKDNEILVRIIATSVNSLDEDRKVSTKDIGISGSIFNGKDG